MKLAEERARQLIEKLELNRDLQDSDLYISHDDDWEDGYAVINLFDSNNVYVAILLIGQDIEIPEVNEYDMLEDIIMSFGWTGRLSYMEGEATLIKFNM